MEYNDNYVIRRAGYEDVDAVYDIMMEAYNNLADKKMLFTDDKEFITERIENRGFCFVAEDDNEIAAYLWVNFAGLDEGNLARHIGLTDEELLDSAVLDSSCVAIKHRGHHLEKRLLKFSIDELRKRGVTHVVAKTHPNNTASLKSIMANGLKPMMHLHESGTERIVLYINLKDDSPKEFFQLYDENMEPIQYIKERKACHRDGDLHAASRMWIFRKGEKGNPEVLLQRRSLCKDSHPDKLDCSSAGHIDAGEEPFSTALREMGEELGIQVDDEYLTYIYKHKFYHEREFRGQLFKNNEVAFVYMYTKPVELSELHVQKEEIQYCVYMDADEVLKRVKSGDDEFCLDGEEYEKVLKVWKETYN